MTQGEYTIAIITALAIECAAMRAVVNDLHRVRAAGDPNQYFAATLPSADPDQPHQLLITVLPQDGTRTASAVSADLIRSFPSVRCLIMCGIAGGVPSVTAPDRHVRLGDIVVATKGIVDYGHVRTVDGTDQVRRHAQGLSSDLVRAALELQIRAYGGEYPWETWLDTNTGKFRPYARPADESDVVYRDGEPVAHPARKRSGHRRGKPRVHYSTIASGDRLLRDEDLRDRIAEEHRVSAIEMEASGVAVGVDLHSRHWFMVRGIADYCDNVGKNDLWHPCASLAAAAYVRAMLAECYPLAPFVPNGPVPQPAAVPLDRPSFHDLLDLARTLLDIPAVADEAQRNTIVDLLPDGIQRALHREQTPEMDVLEILTTCFDHYGGLRALLAALVETAGDTQPVRRAEQAFNHYVEMVRPRRPAGGEPAPAVTR
jgi:nucleoside phosphorylase